MTLKEKISQLIEYAKAHTVIQKYFNENGYTGIIATANGFFATKQWIKVPLFDYEKVNTLSRLCYNNTGVTEVYLKNTHNAKSFKQAFYNCTSLKIVETLDLSNATDPNTFISMFANCYSLIHIRVSGVILTTFDIKFSPLDLESAKNIILHLKNYTDTDQANVNAIYFNESVWELLDADGNTAPHGGTWRDYVFTVLCWNY